MPDDSNDNIADRATDAGDQHTQACIKMHQLGLTPTPTRRLGPAVTVAPDPIDFEINGVQILGIRVTTQMPDMDLTAAVKIARADLEPRGLRPANPEEAETLLRAICGLPTEERPKLSLVQVSGFNGSTTVTIASCRNSSPAFEAAGSYRAPSELILAVVRPSATKTRKTKAKATA